MRNIRVYDREALNRFYATEFPDVNIITDWRYLEGPDRRIGLKPEGGTGWVFPDVKSTNPPPEAAERVQRALAECPWAWAEIDEPPITNSE